MVRSVVGPTAVIDHLVYATPDLDATVRELTARLGVELSPGGAHEGMGTRNHLARLGERCYLEVVGPDPDQRDHDGPYFFGVDTLERATLLTWAVAVDDVDAVRGRAHAAGHDLPAPRERARITVDGARIVWRMTEPLSDDRFGGLVPFVIEWAPGSPHPADTAASGLRLVSLSAVTPDPDPLRRRLDPLGAQVPIDTGDQPGLRAVLATPLGEVTLAQ